MPRDCGEGRYVGESLSFPGSFGSLSRNCPYLLPQVLHIIAVRCTVTACVLIGLSTPVT